MKLKDIMPKSNSLIKVKRNCRGKEILQITRAQFEAVVDEYLAYKSKKNIIAATADVYFGGLYATQAAKKHHCAARSIYAKINFINDYYGNR